MLTVHILGLIYIDGCESTTKRGYMPNGTNPQGADRVAAGHRGAHHPGHVPPHFASIFVEADAVAADTWSPNAKYDHTLDIVDDTGAHVQKHVWEYALPLPSKTVVFPDSADAPAQCVNFPALPKLQTIDPQFVFDSANPDTIVQVPISGGTLQPFQLTSPAAIEWTIAKVPRVLTITAADLEGAFGTITLKQMSGSLGTEVVLANTPDFINGDRHAGHQHFQLFGRLDVNRDGSRLLDPGPPNGLGALPDSHAYVKFLHQNHLMGEPGCSSTCCTR